MKEYNFAIIPTRSGESIAKLRLETAKRRQGKDTVYSPRLINEGNAVDIAFVQPLIFDFDLNGMPDKTRFFINGYHSFSGSGSFNLDERQIDSLIPHLRQLHRNFHTSKQRRKGCFTSSLFGILKLANGSCYTVGFLNSHVFSTQVMTERFDHKVRLIAQIQGEGFTLEEGQSLALPDIFVSEDVPRQAIARYAAQLGNVMGVDNLRKVPDGWCSWYHYFTAINKRELFKNLDIGKSFKPKMDVFQLDDGFQPALGVWLNTNNKFPSGLKEVADRIRGAGRIPGIWVAPFFVQKNVDFVKKNPHWILKDEKGKKVIGMWNRNWGYFRYAYVLDISRPDVEDHLKEVFGTLYSWGFRFFKVDFLFGGSLPGKYYRGDLTSLQILRQGLSLIRREVKDSYLLGSGCPLEAGMGILDSMRVGNDVTPYWSNYVDRWIGGGFEQLSTKNCIRNTLARSFMHNVLFQNDPDCLITRGVKNKLSATEVFTLGQVNALSGGPLMISDDLETLNENSIKLLQEVFGLHEKITQQQRRFFAPGFMEQRMPELQVALGNRDAYVGVYNFDSNPEKRTVNMQDFIPWENYSVRDYYTGEAVEINGSVVKTDEIEEHGARLYYVLKG